jgi:hypothetical protein
MRADLGPGVADSQPTAGTPRRLIPAAIHRASGAARRDLNAGPSSAHI